MCNTDYVEWVGRMHRSGGSLCVILPKPLHVKMGLQRGEYVAIVEVDGMLLMKRLAKSDVLDRDKAALPVAKFRHVASR